MTADVASCGPRGGVGRGAEGRGRNFSSQHPHYPFPGSRYPIGLGTDPTIVNKIKGLRGFGGRVEGGAGAVVQICHCQHYTENGILLA